MNFQAGNIVSAAGCPGGRLPAGGEAGNRDMCGGGVLAPLGVERQSKSTPSRARSPIV